MQQNTTFFPKVFSKNIFCTKSLARNGLRCNEAQRKNRAKGKRSMR